MAKAKQQLFPLEVEVCQDDYYDQHLFELTRTDLRQGGGVEATVRLLAGHEFRVSLNEGILIEARRLDGTELAYLSATWAAFYKWLLQHARAEAGQEPGSFLLRDGHNNL
jgi:hypothetical protein